jgi:hypothetical protein
MLLAASAPLTAQRYAFQMFHVPGSDRTSIYGINNHGGIVGMYWTEIQYRNYAFPFRRYFNGVLEAPLRNPEGGYIGENPRLCCPFASAINNLGTVAGFDGGDGFLLSNGVLTTIQLGATTQILGINDRGDYIALYSDTTGEYTLAYLAGQRTVFDANHIRLWGVAWDRTLVGCENTRGFLQGPNGGRLSVLVQGSRQTCLKGINNAAGKIIGVYVDQNYLERAFVWNYLPDLAPALITQAQPQGRSINYTLLQSSIDEVVVPGAARVEVTGINASGMIVGTASYVYEKPRSFIGTPLP